MFYLRAWNKASASAEALANELDIPRIKHQNSRFVGGPNKTVINWGSSELPDNILACRVINNPAAVSNASNKIQAFRSFNASDASTVPWTTSLDEARDWKNHGETIVIRQSVNSSSGRGIVIVEPDEPNENIVRAPLYTVYRKKAKEYRVHVLGGCVIDVQQKCLSAEFRGRDDINWKVRNLENGFIFRRNNVNIPNNVKYNAVTAVRGLGLDFGAVDVGYNERHDMCYVYEVNTAPGLVGTTIKSYANAFKKFFNGDLPRVQGDRPWSNNDNQIHYHLDNNADANDELVQRPQVLVVDDVADVELDEEAWLDQAQQGVEIHQGDDLNAVIERARQQQQNIQAWARDAQFLDRLVNPRPRPRNP